VYLENEIELVKAVNTGEVTDGLEGTVGAKLLRRDPESRVVVNFHGVSLYSLVSYFIHLYLAELFCSFSSLSFRTSTPYLSSLFVHSDLQALFETSRYVPYTI
jgi:hypothetical protein